MPARTHMHALLWVIKHAWWFGCRYNEVGLNQREPAPVVSGPELKKAKIDGLHARID